MKNYERILPYAYPYSFLKFKHTKIISEENRAIIVGIPYDDGVTVRPGARFGPKSIRDASIFLAPYNMFQGISPIDVLHPIDMGDIDVIPGDYSSSFQNIQNFYSVILEKEIVPIALGGDHSITLPILREMKKKYGRVNVIQFDAHIDTWKNLKAVKYNHGNWLYYAFKEDLIENVLQIGIRSTLYTAKDMDIIKEKRINVITPRMVRFQGIDVVTESINNFPSKNVYITFDIDAVDPAFAPGTGTPEVGGLDSIEVIEIIRSMRMKFIGFDLVEISPIYDNPSEITSILGANIIFEALSTLSKVIQ